MSKEKACVEMSEDELWNAFVCIHNLTTNPHANFYETSTKKEMMQLKKKLKHIGKTKYGWS